MVTSILENTLDTNFKLFIFYHDFEKEKIDQIFKIFKKKKIEIKFIKINKELFKNTILETYYKVSLEAYARLLVPDLLIETDKIIYLDPDVIINQDLNFLFNIDLENSYIAAVKDFNPNSLILFKKSEICKKSENYFNSGVMVMNLKKLREFNFTSKALDLLSQNKIKINFFDQDILNYFFSNNFFQLDPRWNVQLYLEIVTSNYQHSTLTEEEYDSCKTKPFIIHFTIIKPDKLNYFFKYKKYYIYYLEKAGVKFKNRKTSFGEIFLTIASIIFFKTINIFNIKTRNGILSVMRLVTERIANKNR